MSTKLLRKIQLGLETTAGTTVAATTIWRGTGMLDDQRTVEMPTEDVGYASGVDRSYTPKLLSALVLEDTPATFEQLPTLGTVGIKALTTGVADGTGSGKIYSFPFGTNGIMVISSLTAEGGDDQEAEVMEYAFGQDFKLSGGAGAAWIMGGTLLGRQSTPKAFTGSVALPTVEEALFGKSKLYIDEVSGTLGATIKSNTFLGADFTCVTGYKPRFRDGGQLYFSAPLGEGAKLGLNITFEHDAIGAAQKVAWRAETPKLIRILVEGSNITTAGVYSKKSIILDLAGKWQKFEKIGERDGNDIIAGSFKPAYDPTAAFFARLIVVNEKATLP